LSILSVEDLGISYEIDKRDYLAVNDVNFKLNEGESMALVGESGSGKSTIGLSLMGLLPPNGKVSSGLIRFHDREIALLKEREVRELRWKHISMVFQGSMNALDPILTVRSQLSEVLKFHENKNKSEAETIIVDMFQKEGVKH